MLLPFCTYITIYSGNKLPPFYIGSTSITNITNGYRGSVNSKRYKHIWKHEIKTRPYLFKTFIIKKFITRIEALNHENYLLVKFKAIKNPLYINLGMYHNHHLHVYDHRGKNNPNFGKTASAETKLKMSISHLNHPVTDNTREKLRAKGLKQRHTCESKLKMRNIKLGKKTSEQTKYKISRAKSNKYIIYNLLTKVHYYPDSLKIWCIEMGISNVPSACISLRRDKKYKHYILKL